MRPAARITDPIDHTSALFGLIEGALVGVLLVAGAIADVLTGGLAVPVELALIAEIGASIGIGAKVGELLGSLSFASTTTGSIIRDGSPDVIVSGQKAARAHCDVASCSYHGPTPVVIAEGSGITFINGLYAARVGDLCACGAAIESGSPNVYIGGDPVQTDDISLEVPEWVDDTMDGISMGATIIERGVMAGIVSYFGGKEIDKLSDKYGGELFGEGSDGQKIFKFAVGYVAGKGLENFGGLTSKIRSGKGPTATFLKGGSRAMKANAAAESAGSPAQENESGGDSVSEDKPGTDASGEGGGPSLDIP